MEKHFSLLQKFLDLGGKKFYNFGPRTHLDCLPSPPLLIFLSELEK
jgi:hypothetical protein